MLCIRNGRVINPAEDMDLVTDVWIQGDRIVGYGKEPPAAYDGSVDYLDARGCIVAPGFVDVHVHFRDPGFT